MSYEECVGIRLLLLAAFLIFGYAAVLAYGDDGFYAGVAFVVAVLISTASAIALIFME
jgi:hypothetical protein